MTRAVGIYAVIVAVIVVDDRRLVVDAPIAIAIYTEAKHPWAVDIALGHKNPEIKGSIERCPYAHTGPHGCPAVVPAARTPIDPGRPPLVVGYPGPAIKIVVKPATVVKRRPAPVVVGSPGVAVLGHYPLAVGSIRLEVTIHIVGRPDGSVLRVRSPASVRRKLIIERLEVD